MNVLEEALPLRFGFLQFSSRPADVGEVWKATNADVFQQEFSMHESSNASYTVLTFCLTCLSEGIISCTKASKKSATRRFAMSWKMYYVHMQSYAVQFGRPQSICKSESFHHVCSKRLIPGTLFLTKII